MVIDHTCANPSCDCRVENTGDFCSDNCREHGDGGKPGQCTCSHVDCGTSTPEARGVPDQNENG